MIVIPYGDITNLGKFDAQELVSRETELLEIGFQTGFENFARVDGVTKRLAAFPIMTRTCAQSKLFHFSFFRD